MVEEFESVLVAELYYRVLQGTNLFKHLVGYLGVQANVAVLELMKGTVKGFVYGQKLVLEPVHLVLVLYLSFLEAGDLVLELGQIGLAALNVLLAFHEENLLLLVVLLDSLG